MDDNPHITDTTTGTRAYRVVVDGRELTVLVEPARKATSAPTQDLDDRVAELVRAGLGNRAIGQRLGLSDSGVRKRLSRLFRRYGVGSRVQLALILGERA